MRPSCNPSEAWRCATPYPSRRSPSDCLTCGRQFKLNLCDEHFEEPDHIQARAAPWSGPDPAKPETQAEHARAKISCFRRQERPKHRPAYSGAFLALTLPPRHTRERGVDHFHGSVDGPLLRRQILIRTHKRSHNISHREDRMRPSCNPSEWTSSRSPS